MKALLAAFGLFVACAAPCERPPCDVPLDHNFCACGARLCTGCLCDTAACSAGFSSAGHVYSLDCAAGAVVESCGADGGSR